MKFNVNDKNNDIIDQDAKIGQGLISTRWLGWNLLFIVNFCYV